MLQKKLFLFTFLLIFISVMAQPGNRLTKQDTLKTIKGDITEWIITQPNSKAKQIVRMKAGQKHSVQETYGYNGKLTEQQNYANGHLEGENLKYDSQGNLREKSHYKYSKNDNKSVLDGLYQSYQNNQPISEINYKNGLKDGQFKEFFSDGKIKTKGNYLQDLLNGKKEEFHTSGNLAILRNYKIIPDKKGNNKSVLDGPFTQYKNDNQLLASGTYIDGKKTGIWKQYFSNNNQLESEVTYKNDNQHGPYVYYSKDGKLLRKGIFYYETEINGKKIKNAYDGKIETYHSNGKPQQLEYYKMGKKEGVWQRYYDTGILNEERFYQNDLQTGKATYFDKTGQKIRESNYVIIKRDTVPVSVKNGFDYEWNNNIITAKSYFENGLEQGVRETFFNDGKPHVKASVQDGYFNGKYEVFHENGQLQLSGTYLYKKNAPGGPKTDMTGWISEFDSNGKPVTKRYNDTSWNTVTSFKWQDDILLNFDIRNLMELTYFPDGALMSFKLSNYYNQPVQSYFYYKNQSVRKLNFQDPESCKLFNADFTQEGNLSNIYTENNSGKNNKPKEALVQQYFKSVNPKWNTSPLFTDKIREGNYELRYANNAPFLNISFKENLPHGKFIAFEPIKGDTLVYVNYQMGNVKGTFVEKFAGKNTVRRGYYYDNGQLAQEKLYHSDGRPMRRTAFTESGQQTEYSEFHENGKLRTTRNDLEKTFAEYDLNGNLYSEKIKLPGNENLRINRTYHNGTKQLKSVSYYYKDQLDSIYTQYHANGQKQFEMHYKNGKRNGSYKAYTENGKLATTGQYTDDKMEGKWIKYNGTASEEMNYEKGNLVVVPTSKKCECFDTELNNGKIGFAPTLSGLVDLKTLKNHLPGFIKPVDDFNFSSIFYINYQFSNSSRAGFSSLKLLFFKPFSFLLPADQQVKITLNPCHTKGYISSLDATANYDFEDVKNTSATLYAKRISLSLVNSPLKSDDVDYPDFTAFFDVDRIDYDYKDKLDFSLKKAPNYCFTSGKIKDFLKVAIVQAQPLLFKNPNEKTNLVYSSPLHLSEAERNNFFGLWIQEATIVFEHSENGKTMNIKANSDFMLASGKFATGRIRIVCEKTAEDTFVFKSSGQNDFTFSSQVMKKEWMKRGFTRITAEYNAKEKTLDYYFFAE